MNAPPKPEKLLYTAKFSGPKGELNPMGLKVPGLISVQVFPITPTRWILKNPDTKGVFSKHEFETPNLAMNYCFEIFETLASDGWEITDTFGQPYSPPLEK